MQRHTTLRRKLAVLVGLCGIAVGLASCQGATPSNVSSTGQGATGTTVATNPSLRP